MYQRAEETGDEIDKTSKEFISSHLCSAYSANYNIETLGCVAACLKHYHGRLLSK